MSLGLIATARRLLGSQRRSPSESDLRRAVSTAYYAAFDALGRLCADEIVGRSAADRAAPEWTRVYRALNHGRSEAAFGELEPRRRAPGRQRASLVVDPSIATFCDVLERLRISRTEADYDPRPSQLTRADVELLITEAESAIRDLRTAPRDQRRTLVFACIIPKR